MKAINCDNVNQLSVDDRRYLRELELSGRDLETADAIAYYAECLLGLKRRDLP